jgi:type IV secretion system protein VirB6
LANAVTTVISDMLKTVDQTSEAFIETAYGGLGLQVEFLFRSMLILYVVWWGYMILAGRANGSPIEIAFKLMRAFFIYFMATNWEAFAATLFVLAQKVPDIISDTIIKAVAGSAGLESGSDDVSGVVRILDAVFEAALKIWEQVTSDTLGYITGAFVGTVVFVFAMFFIGFAVAAILAAKLMLAITLALAPVFIILALYQYTTRYTDGFLTLVAQLVVGQIMIYSFLGLYYKMIAMAISATEGQAIDSKLAYVAPFVLVCLIGSYVLSQIQVLAGIITGGSGTNLAGAYGGMRRSVRGIKAGSEATGGGIANSARGIMLGANRFDKAVVGALDRRDAQKLAMQREVTKNSQV